MIVFRRYAVSAYYSRVDCSYLASGLLLPRRSGLGISASVLMGDTMIIFARLIGGDLLCSILYTFSIVCTNLTERGITHHIQVSTSDTGTLTIDILIFNTSESSPAHQKESSSPQLTFAHQHSAPPTPLRLQAHSPPSESDNPRQQGKHTQLWNSSYQQSP